MLDLSVREDTSVPKDFSMFFLATFFRLLDELSLQHRTEFALNIRRRFLQGGSWSGWRTWRCLGGLSGRSKSIATVAVAQYTK
ncbi:hypothetical protein HHI36_009203 [Cryptolaemus montrouzieri]|uniref:Uncharacterized protein n=1 Tax=Cryptolaemus montrouzieri TaxID=559131 RepID=A0ABD2MV47_9CUCU